MDKQPSKKEILEQVKKLQEDNRSDGIELAKIRAEREIGEKEEPIEVSNTNFEEKIDTPDDTETEKLMLNAFKEELEKEDFGENPTILENSKNTTKQSEPEKKEEPSFPENTSTEEIISKTLNDEFGEKENGEKISDIENQTPLLADIEEAKEIFEKLPEEDKQKIGWGLKTLGFKVEQKKNNFFANVFNKISKKLPEDKTTFRFCKNLGKGFMEDSEKAFKTAEKITNSGEKHRIQNTGLLFGNILRYGRIVSDFTGISFASPLRYVMMGGMALSRGARAATATRLENEDLIEKTRIQDADKAAEEAWKIYELAQKKEGTENVSAGALKNAYLTEIPKDLQKRLEEPGTANNLVQNVLRRYLEYSIDKINLKIEKIENDTTLSQKEKETKIETILNKQKEKLTDYDGMLTQVGTVDELAMAGRYAQTAGKVIVAAMTVETLYLSYERISGLLSHILSGSDSSIPMHTGIGKNVIEETLKTKTGNQDTLKTIAEQKDSVGTKINDHEIKTEELKNKILEQFKTNETTIHEGEGIEHSFIRQIEHNPKLATELGFKGNINDVKALHEFAGREAHIIAIKEGYIGNAGHEVRITGADKMAPEIKMENGHVVIQEKIIVDGKLETSTIHHEGDKFGEDINKYEHVYTPIHHENISQNISGENYDSSGLPYDEQAEINAHTENLDIINQENPKMIEHENTLKEIPIETKESSAHIIEWDGEKYQKIPIKDGKIYMERWEDWVNSPKNTYHLTVEQAEKAQEISHKIVSSLFANKNTTEIQNIDSVLNSQADTIIETKENDVKEICRPVCKYINKLYEISKVKPLNKNLLQIGETGEQYITRALFKIASLGKLDEVKF